MPMQRAEMEALVERLEQRARSQPQLYRAQVLALAALGYGFLAAIVLLLLALTLAAAASVIYLKAAGLKLLLIVGALLWVVLRALWVRLLPPAGDIVTRVDAPQLFAMLDSLRQRLHTPRIDRVLLTAEFNAGAAQTPRLGLFGWYRTDLLLGLPLLKAMTVPQCEAVLAHELGHLAGGHARLGNWVYRLRLIWTRLEAALESDGHWATGFIRGFYRWYIPYFTAFSFPLARTNEYEADAASARLTSARIAAQALTNVNVVGRFLSEHYWPGIHATARELAHPAFAPYSDFGPQAFAQVPNVDREKWLQAALATQTTVDDTHPALKDRLAALGAPAEVVVPRSGAGAEQLLGASLTRFQQLYDDRWRDGIAESWQKFFEQTQQQRTVLAALRDKTADEKELLQLADLEQAVGEGAARALQLRRDALTRFPESNAAKFALASQLLQADDASGIALMETVIADDIDALVPGGTLLRDHHWRNGAAQLARAWHARVLERSELLHDAHAERARLTTSDRWVRHELSAEALATLRSRLREIAGLRSVYLARKSLRKLAEHPLYVLGFRVTPWYRLRNRALGEKVQQELRSRVDWPGETFILNLEQEDSRFWRKFRWMRGTRLL